MLLSGTTPEEEAAKAEKQLQEGQLNKKLVGILSLL